MKKIINLLFVIALLVTISSCKKVIGEGPVVTEDRAVNPFYAVKSSISADVHFTQSAVRGVKVSAQRNILNVLETYTSGNELIIQYRNNTSVRSRERIQIEVSSPEIHGLTISGSGNISASDTIESSDLSLTISGSGNIRLDDVITNSLKAKISGSGGILISGGKINKESLTISGSGSINTENAPAVDVTTNTSGSGEMRVHAVDKLNVKISGSGSVYYKGNPETDVRISGSGRVRKQ